MGTDVRYSAPITATIPANASISNTIAVAELAFGGMIVPSALTGTAVTFNVSADSKDTASGSRTFEPLKRQYDSSGTITTAVITIPVVGTEALLLPPEVFNFTYFQIVSNGTEASPAVFLLSPKS